MAQVEGIQINILAKIDQLQKALEDAKKAVASVAQESEKQSERISNPLREAANQVAQRYGWAAGQIAGHLTSLVHPASLAAAAVAALGAGLLAYYESLQEKTIDVDNALKTHGQLIKDLKSAYGEAMVGLEAYTKESENSVRNRIGGSLFELDQALKQTASTFMDQFGPTIYRAMRDAETGVTTFGDSFFQLPAKFKPFRAAIETLQASIRAGNPDFVTFKNSVDEVGASAAGTNPQLAATAAELAKLAANGAASQQAIAANSAALNALSADSRAAAAALSGYNSAIKELESFGPKKSERERIEAAFKLASVNARDEEDYRRAVTARMTALDELAAKEAARAPSGGAADNSAEKLAREQEMITKRLEMLTVGWGTEEEKLAAHLIRNQDLINQAREKEAIDDETHKILMLGAEEEYQKRIQNLRDKTNMMALSSTAKMFGSLMSLTESFGKKGTGLAKAFGIAQALINTYVGVTKALSTLPPPASYAAAAATLAQGMAQVASIRSVSDTGKGGGGAVSSAGSGAAATAASSAGGGSQPGGNSVYINLQGQSFGRDQVRDLVKQIADFQKDGGQVVFA
jgi:hypothetical protein